MMKLRGVLFSCAALCAVAVGCSNGGGSAVPSPAGPGAAKLHGSSPLSDKIKHVIVIIQENRSTDNLFHGLPGADTANTGMLHDGTIVPLTPVPLGTPNDLPHARSTYFVDWDKGKMDGFDLEVGAFYPHGAGLNPYQYVRRTDVQPYFDMATQFAFADKFFGSSASESYTEHQYLIAGQSAMAYTNPEGKSRWVWGCDSSPDTLTRILNPANGRTLKKVYPCFDYQTIGDELDTAGVSWKFYAAGFGFGGYDYSAYDAIRHIRLGADWTTHISSPEKNILKDIAAGNLPSVSYVTPSELNSDHGGSVKATGGPSWVASIVNAVGASPYWSSTAIFVTWDEWGGWYDHAFTPMLDVMGPGFRVPLVIVSPYAQHGFVSHNQHEFGSILHFIEEDFGLPALTQVDARADDLLDIFNFNQAVKPLVPIRARMTTAQILAQPENFVIPDDDTGNQNLP